ncbi:type VII secretion target [Kitasatospora sp. NBC_01287]|uniref:WXG100 family type VII secretion target n=1 Tax=Kitasatospora sp. NBC_01287 TaxID=2903573 RepID=UPI002253F4ED|nr:type VII secretion target [Kitasatospora sp. NBC_01287]MCX4751353.1 type VII secretion target [Kitasatospora sp. NBC_01287]
MITAASIIRGQHWEGQMGDQPPSGPGPGYTVDYATLTAAANTLEQAAGDLATTSGKLAHPPAFTADTFGDYGAADAARGFVGAWQDEVQVDHDAIAQLADKVRQSAANYQAGDAAAATGFGGQ